MYVFMYTDMYIHYYGVIKGLEDETSNKLRVPRRPPVKVKGLLSSQGLFGVQVVLRKDTGCTPPRSRGSQVYGGSWQCSYTVLRLCSAVLEPVLAQHASGSLEAHGVVTSGV